jgi:hypothetical protein
MQQHTTLFNHQICHGLSAICAALHNAVLQAVVKKNAPVVGRSLDSIDMWGSYGVIVVGAELGKGKTSRASNLGQLVLQPGDLLVFIASEYIKHKTRVTIFVSDDRVDLWQCGPSQLLVRQPGGFVVFIASECQQHILLAQA